MKKHDQHSMAGEEMTDKLTVEPKEHVPPRTPAEELTAEMYASNSTGELLGVFDKLATLNASQAARISQYLQQIFRIDIPIDCLLQQTTIDSLVNFLSRLWGGREIVEEIAWTFLQIEKLSDDEVKSHLAKELSMSDLEDTK